MSTRSQDRLRGIRLKLERAKEHVRNLESMMQDFRNINPYRFRIEDDPKTGDKIHSIEILSDTPDCFSALRHLC